MIIPRTGSNALWHFTCGILLLFLTCIFTGCNQRELSLQQLKQKAEKNNPEAQFRLGKMYLFGEGNVKQNRAQAFKWLLKSANRRYPAGEYLTGTMYLAGKGAKKDRKEAFKYFQRAADQNFAAAQNKMGERYLHGWDVPKDFVASAKWFEKAAKQGMAEAQYNFGQRYFKSEGVQQSDATSAHWLLQAADQGHYMAQYLLALRYAEGGADRIDHVEAYKWAKLCGQEKIIRSIAKKMTKEQKAEAEAKAQKFVAVLEMEANEPPESYLIYWLMGIPTAILYGVAFYLLLRKKRAKLAVPLNAIPAT